MMKLDPERLNSVVGSDSEMTQKNVLKYLEVIMTEINGHLHDLTMLELLVRTKL